MNKLFKRIFAIRYPLKYGEKAGVQFRGGWTNAIFTVESHGERSLG